MDWLNETIFIITTGTNSDKLWKSELYGQKMSPMSRRIFLNFKKAAMGGVILLLLGTCSNLVRGIISMYSSL